MRMHISLNVRDVPVSVAFYLKVFGVPPQKQTVNYAKFDVCVPALNFSLVSSSKHVSSVNHLGIEVESMKQLAGWKQRLEEHGLLQAVEENVACCFARQDKLWFTDPDGNPWEIFVVHEQLKVTGPLRTTGCCESRDNALSSSTTCTSRRQSGTVSSTEASA